MLTLDERLKFCRACKNRKTNFQIGLVCKLTDQKPAFEVECEDFDIDQVEATRLANLEREIREETANNEFFSYEKKGIRKGIVGGLVMMIIAAIWFFAGLSAGIIFYYPPILFLIGLFALFKGAITGNISGKQP